MGKPSHRKLRDAVRYRLVIPLGKARSRVVGWAKHRLWRRVAAFDPPRPLRLHVGCGRESLPGWINTDIQTYAEVDLALDITRGFPYSGLELIYSEHFLEHLDPEAALRFLADANRALRPGGWLRLTTPNLDWVWTHVYSPDSDAPDRLRRAVHANRSFYGWRHRFVWNRETLAEALAAAGFGTVRWCEHGHSEVPELHGLERHEPYPDTPDCPHVLVVEAQKGELDPDRLRSFQRLIEDELSAHLAD